MTTLNKYSAIAAINVLLPVDFVDVVTRKSAIFSLILATHERDRQEIATHTIRELLNLFGKQDNRLIKNYDLLTRALHIANHWTPQGSIAERLVTTAAESGFHGRFPELPIRLLGRPPSEGEVIALISAYVTDRASRDESTEEKLIQFAKAYLAPTLAVEQIARIEKFVYDWNNEPDL